ncbi:hypothetical protein [Prosthecobacter sp.]|uniref:hypothetical protein n=1 Tax=Prosthecobacter sp. TaxID=1965333 RepID=UPI0037841A57
MIKTSGGVFEVTIDGFPDVMCSAPTSDAALSLAAQALQRLESEGAVVPDRVRYPWGDQDPWEEYVINNLCPMGKMPFAELPTGQRFLRQNFPTMWDKSSATTAHPLAGAVADTEIPGEEIVWHHVWALSDELSPSERQERLAWSGYPDLHF